MGSKMGPVGLFKVHQGPPNSQNCTLFTLWPLYEKLVFIFPLLYIYNISHCPERVQTDQHCFYIRVCLKVNDDLCLHNSIILMLTYEG